MALGLLTEVRARQGITAPSWTPAYRVLMRQWRIAFDIGAENRRGGVHPTSPFRLLRLTREYARTSRLHLREQTDQPTPVPAVRRDARVRI
jgi:hypothetical protein